MTTYAHQIAAAVIEAAAKEADSRGAEHIADAIRSLDIDAIIARVSDPSADQKPFGYFHEFLNHEGKGNGVWIGCNNKSVVKQAHIDGKTGDEIVTLYAAPASAKGGK